MDAVQLQMFSPRFSIQGAPWTLGVASIKSVDRTTPNGFAMSTSPTMQGFAHGPASNASNTGMVSGVLQVVTPVKITTNLNPPNATQAAWGVLTLHVIPEPGPTLLLGTGVVMLVWLGKTRTRR